MKLFSESSVRTYTFYPSDKGGRCTAKDVQDALKEIAKTRGVPLSRLLVSNIDVGSTRVIIHAWVSE